MFVIRMKGWRQEKGPCHAGQAHITSGLSAISRSSSGSLNTLATTWAFLQGAWSYPSTWARPRNVPSPPGHCLWPWNLPSSVLKCFTVPSAQPTRICGQRSTGWRAERGGRAPDSQLCQRSLTCVSPPAPQHRALTASSRRDCPDAVKFAACLRWRFTPAGHRRQSHQSRETVTPAVPDARLRYPPFRMPVSVPTHTWFQRAPAAAIAELGNPRFTLPAQRLRHQRAPSRIRRNSF